MTTFSLQDQDLFRRRAYIGGQWCDADTGATLKVNNPATGEVLGTVPLMGANETRRAIDAAKEAFVQWGRKPAKDRSTSSSSMARFDHGQRRGFGEADDSRTR